ncbi:flagellar hook-length control protein FliK [Vreelandella zhaodongensis]|uniref:flagellar hook-length control protein FliK n=1 Tax=Vreelandella zhaodongensis TaxID=1176240 RepID=UPI003EC0175F
MTIELLLSMHQGQGTSSSTHSPASGSPRAAPGVFFEALTQAVTQQSRLPTSVQADGVPTDVLSAVTEQLASLDIELDAEALESIRENMHENGRERAPENVRDSVKAPRQAAEQAATAGMQDMGLERSSQPLPPSEQTASSDTSKGAETTPLNAAIAEVASRLALIASYSVAPAAQGNEPASAAPASAPSQGATTTGQTSLDSRLPADNVPSSPASFLARTTLPMSARLLGSTGNSAGNSTENSNETTASTPVSRQPEKAQNPSVQPQSFSISQAPTSAPNSSSTSTALPLANQPAMPPLNTALATTPNPGTEAMAGLLAEVDANSSANKGSEQPIPVSLASQQPAAPNSLTATTLNTPVTSPAWPSQLGQQLIQFAQRGGEHQVKMQLHPAELGPLSITLKVTEQGAQAHFLSSHAAVRQVIEQAIPQLREALAEQGISLDDTSVGEQQNPNEQSFAQQMPGKNAGNQKGEQGNDSAPSPVEENSQETPDGRVDIYA